MMTFISNFLFLNSILAIVLAGVLWALRKALFRWRKGKKIHKLITFYFPVFQYIIWSAFICYLVWQLSKYNQMVALVALFVFVFLGKSFLQNFLTGILFRLEKHDLRGISCFVDEKAGVIVAYGMTQVCLKANDGSSNYIPYEKFYTDTFVRTVKMEQTNELQTLKIYVPQEIPFSQEVLDRIRTKVLLNPYVATNEEVHVLQGKEDGKQWILLHYHLLNSERSDAVKEVLRKEIKEIK